MRRQRQSLKQQQGVVIVIALLIVALVVTMSYTMMSRLARDTRRTTLIMRDVQAEQYAQGSLIWAIDQLRHNWEQKKQNQLIDVIPIKSPINKMNGYAISSTIYDMQSRFNLNNVNQEEAQAPFKQLIQIVDPKIRSDQAKDMMYSIADWLGSPTVMVHYAQYYLHQRVPYRPAYKPMISISELLLVKGMTPALYRALQPLVTALPQGVGINVQTAPLEVLASLSPTMTLDAARTIVETRKQKPFLTLQQFQAMDVVKNDPGMKEGLLTVTSQYFLIETIVTIEKQRLVIYTLLERIPKDRTAAVNILWQSKGTW